MTGHPQGSRWGRALVGPFGAVVTRLLVAGVVFWIAFENGGFPVATWTAVAIAVWWAIGLGVAAGALPVARLRGGAGAAVALLVGFAVLSAASSAWASSAEGAVTESARVALYAGVVVLTVLAVPPGAAARWSDGLALATAATAVLALATRFFPGLTSQSAFAFLPEAVTRLNYPLGYWNALAVFAGLGAPLLLRVALDGRPGARAAAVGLLPALATTVYLTSSRTGAASVGVGVFLFFLLVDRRLEAVGAIAVGAAGGIGAVALVAQRHAVVDGPVTGAAAIAQGRSAALIVVLVCGATAVTYALLDGLAWSRIRSSPRREAALAGAALLVALAGLVVADPVARFRTFRDPVAPAAGDANYVQQHLFSMSGNGRWQYWQVAAHEFHAHPLFGGGAGSYAEWWNRDRPIAAVARNAHSLYVEVAGELGIAGLLLVTATFAVALVAGGRRLRHAPSGGRATAAAVVASFAAFVVAVGFDWFWQIAALSICGMILLGLLVGSSLEEDAPAPAGGSRWALRAALVVLAAVGLAVEATLFLADARVTSSQRDFREGKTAAAASAALQSSALEPWASTPYLQLALVREQEGSLDAAAAAIDRAITRDRANWSLWFVFARIETERARIPAARRSLHEARRLNPLGPIPS